MKKEDLSNRRLRIILAAIVLILIGGYAGYTISWNIERNNVDSEPTPYNIYREVNRVRVDHGKAELRLDKRLATSAREKCSDMVKYDYYEHKSPIGQEEGYKLIFNNVPDADYGGENLNQGDLSAPEFVDSWLSSKDHKEAILNDNYNITGIAVCRIPSEPNNSHTVVQHFAQAP